MRDVAGLVQEHDRHGHADRDQDDRGCDQPAPQPSPRDRAWHGGEGKQIAAGPGVVCARDDDGVPAAFRRRSARPPGRAAGGPGAPVDALGDADGVYVVGGAVRDLLRGDAPVDLDLVADRELGELIAELSSAGGAPARVHDRFGTATLVLDAGRFDLARARREHYPHPGALPEVEPAPIEEDLRRRDFTVNALALGLGGARRGELLAVPGALDDLDTGTLRVLHDASFRDDPTRLLRLARYAGRLSFAPDEHDRAPGPRGDRRRRAGDRQRRASGHRTAAAGRRGRSAERSGGASPPRPRRGAHPRAGPTRPRGAGASTRAAAGRRRPGGARGGGGRTAA